MSQKVEIKKIGTAQAALLAAMLGVLTIALTNLGTEMSDACKNQVYNIGKLWMPGADGIGPYSGKETIALLVWLVSWAVFHRILRAREWNHLAVIALFLMGIAVATTLVWPPVFQLLIHH